jgi:hypothetical protein
MLTKCPQCGSLGFGSLAALGSLGPAPLGPGSAIAEGSEGASRVYRANSAQISQTSHVLQLQYWGQLASKINWGSIRGQAQMGENPKHSDPYGNYF